MTTVRISSGVTSGGTYNATISVYASGSTLDIVMSGGVEIVSNGGVSNSTYLRQGTSETVLHNGFASSTVIDYGAELSIKSGGTSRETIDVDGGEYVYNGGTSIDSKIKGGNEILFGGKSVSATLYGSKSNGYCVETIISGGISSATRINAGAIESVGEFGEYGFTGHDISHASIDRGTQSVSSAGETRGTVIEDGGSELVYSSGTSYNTKISKGREAVSSGGVAIGTTVFNGGSEIVSSGGVTSRTIIEGGKVEIDKGGKAAGLVTFSGGDGELVLDAGAMPGATISGFAASDTIVLSAIPYSTSDSVSVNASNIVTISAGDKTYNLHVAGATVGEKDFSFNSGSVLTRNEATQPSFLRPAASAAPEANVLDEKVIVKSTTSPASAPAGAVTSSTVWPAWQPTNAFTIRQENMAQIFSSHTS